MSPVVKTPYFYRKGKWVQSLIKELKSHMLHGTAQKNKNKTPPFDCNILTSWVEILYSGIFILSFWDLLPIKLSHKIAFEPVIYLCIISSGDNWRYMKEVCDEIVTMGRLSNWSFLAQWLVLNRNSIKN